MSVKALEGPGATSPRPWRVGKGGGAVVADGGCAREAFGWGPCDLDSLDYYGGHLVAESIPRADAELIVRAVNAHDDLLATLKTIAYEPIGPSEKASPHEILDGIVRLARAAIAKAEPRS